MDPYTPMEHTAAEEFVHLEREFLHDQRLPGSTRNLDADIAIVA